MIGLQLAMAAVMAVVGLSFLADPCGGGGDLCLGGAVGLGALGIAAAGGAATFIWWWRRRASPLLVWDALMVTLGGAVVLASSGGTMTLITLAPLVGLLLGIPAGILAGREVIRHRLEPLLAIAGLGSSFLLGLEAGIIVSALGLGGLGVGWLINRSTRRAPPGPPIASA